MLKSFLINNINKQFGIVTLFEMGQQTVKLKRSILRNSDLFTICYPTITSHNEQWHSLELPYLEYAIDRYVCVRACVRACVSGYACAHVLVAKESSEQSHLKAVASKIKNKSLDTYIGTIFVSRVSRYSD